MNSYLFSVGNSTDGHIGLCARVNAASKQEALKKVKHNIEINSNSMCMLDVKSSYLKDADYVCVYVNPDAFTIEDIEDWEELQE